MPEVPYIHAADEIPDAALVFVNKTLLRQDMLARSKNSDGILQFSANLVLDAGVQLHL